VHPHHAHQAHDAVGRRALRRDDAGAGRVASREREGERGGADGGPGEGRGEAPDGGGGGEGPPRLAAATPGLAPPPSAPPIPAEIAGTRCADGGAVTSSAHDALFKAAFSKLRHARGLLRSLVPEPLGRRIAWSTLRIESGIAVGDEDLGEQRMDLVYSARAGR